MIHQIGEKRLKYITPKFDNLAPKEIIKSIMCAGEQRLSGGGYHPTKAMSYMMRCTKPEIIQAVKTVNAKYAIDEHNHILYPYMFDFRIHDQKDNVMRANWFSGMGQGFALMAYGRHGQKEICDKVLNSFETETITQFTDNGYHYMEYPGHCDALNGHIYAMYGIYEHWHRYQSKQAEHLFLKGVEWVKHNLHGYRNPKDASFYCTDHKIISDKVDGRYHKIHIEQLHYLYEITDDDWFSQQARLFYDDYNVSGYVALYD
jgi:hypothetical protein